MAVQHDPQSNRTLGDLVVDARRGDPAAVEELCSRYQHRLLTVAGKAGAEHPESIVERALTQAMLATDGNDGSDTVQFEQDVFARVLAAVMPVEDTRASYGEPETEPESTDPDHDHGHDHDHDPTMTVPSDGGARARPGEAAATARGATAAPHDHGVRLLLPETAYEPHVAGQIEPPELAQPSGSWWGPTVLALAIAAVAALAAGSAYLVVGGNAGSTAADQPTPTGALADGLRIAGRTATSGGGPAAGTEQGASPSADLPVGVTPTSGRTANTVEREAPTGADPTTTTPGNATTAVPDSPTTVDPQPAATTAAGPAAAPVGDFRDRVLTGDDLTNQDLRFYDFSGATLTGVDFSRSDLRQASFAGAVLDGVEFAGADISSADFTGAVVRNGVVNGFWREASPPINLP